MKSVTTKLMLGFLVSNMISLNAIAAYDDYKFVNGYPTKETVQKAYDDADLNRAIQAYKFFYPTVAFSSGFEAFKTLNVKPNESGVVTMGTPKQIVFTPNSDTPYSFVPVDLTNGPVVIDMPAGPIMGAINDMNEIWIMDYGLPGPDAGKGGKHLILPPEYKGKTPEGYYVGKSTTNKVVLLLRALPVKGDLNKAFDLIKTVKIHALDNSWTINKWIDISDKSVDFTPNKIETNIKYWELLHKIINNEPANKEYRNYYGELAILGIKKGEPFKPNSRMKKILEQAAKTANAQMRVQSFADRREDRKVWKGINWEWATLRPENGTFDTPYYKDLDAREKWFYQAMVESPAMFRRASGQGSVYWLGNKDNNGAYLDGAKTYKLRVPLTVPAKLFWSVTVYDSENRSEIATDQKRAAIRSLFELKDVKGKYIDLYFGPKAPEGQENFWIKTIPGKGWFTYFRVYGPEENAFNGKWQLNDFEEVK